MTYLIACYITCLGLALGSFFNVAALRVPVRQSVVRPASHCPHCGYRLRGKDLWPVLSYVLSRGKCRSCGKNISALYPVGEAVAGLLFLWVYLRFGLTREALIGFLLVSLCLIVTISGLKYMLIPNRILLFFAPLFLLARILYPIHTVWSHLAGAAIGGSVILLIALLSRGGMGMGDAKLFALLGWAIGSPLVIVALIIASTAGTVVGGMLQLLRIVKRRQPIPFGPFLAFGTIIAYGYGSDMVEKYLSLFL